jgi:hypothetical protein
MATKPRRDNDLEALLEQGKRLATLGLPGLSQELRVEPTLDLKR